MLVAYRCGAGCNGWGRHVTVEEREIEGGCISSRGKRLSRVNLEEHEETKSQIRRVHALLFETECK